MEGKTKKNRAKNFSAQEELVLVQLVDEKKSIIENKKSDAVTWKQKQQAWQNVAEQFTAKTGVQRRWKSLRDKFDTLKRKSKEELSAEKKETYRTAGGQTAKELIASMRGDATATGLNYIFDSDTCNASEDLTVTNNPISTESELHQEIKYENTSEESQSDLESTWSPNNLKQPKSSKLLAKVVRRKRNLEAEKIKLTLIQQDFYKGENARALEKHEQELIAMKMKNELLRMEVFEKKTKLGWQCIIETPNGLGAALS